MTSLWTIKYSGIKTVCWGLEVGVTFENTVKQSMYSNRRHSALNCQDTYRLLPVASCLAYHIHYFNSIVIMPQGRVTFGRL